MDRAVLYSPWMRCLPNGNQAVDGPMLVLSALMLPVLIVPLVLPLGYVWKHYVLAPADRWR